MNLPKNNIQILDNIFMIQRIIDPQSKKIIVLENNVETIDSHQCFDFWENDAHCPNCISMRALNENSSFSKLESLNDKLYMIIATPLNVNDKIYVLELIKDVTNDTLFSNYKDKTIEELRSEINKLNMLVVKDELTNMYNVRYLNENLPVVLNHVSYLGYSISVIMLDIDKFKSINDTYGHLCGDYIIKEFANLLNSHMKKIGGWTCRYGGDEFICVIENISEKDTYDKVHNFKNILSNTNFTYLDHKINITCSYGIAHISEENVTFTEALNLVDSKLYESKKTRNTVS